MPEITRGRGFPRSQHAFTLLINSRDIYFNSLYFILMALDERRARQGAMAISPHFIILDNNYFMGRVDSLRAESFRLLREFSISPLRDAAAICRAALRWASLLGLKATRNVTHLMIEYYVMLHATNAMSIIIRIRRCRLRWTMPRRCRHYFENVKCFNNDTLYSIYAIYTFTGLKVLIYFSWSPARATYRLSSFITRFHTCLFPRYIN